jgi:hypothetical protein
MYRAHGTPRCVATIRISDIAPFELPFSERKRGIKLTSGGDAVGAGRLTLTPPDLPSPFRCGHRQVALLALPESVSLAKARRETLRSAD